MVFLAYVAVAAVAVGLALANAQRRAPWLLAAGALVFGYFLLLSQVRISWPDFGAATIIVFNPYLMLNLSFVLLVAGGIGTLVKIARIVGRLFARMVGRLF